MKTVLLSVVIFFFSGVQLFSQTGSIAGRVNDAETGESLISVNILVQNTSYGTSTDLEGIYSIRNLTPGIYDIRFSYISYATVTVTGVEVIAGRETRIDVQLQSEATQLDEIVVTSELLKTSENAMLKIQQNAMNILDAVSIELIKKNNSSDGADVLKRMTGVSITEGKYAVIRGIGDRYNNTMLNGANLPSTDPEKKSFSYDIFPANLIENVVTAKTFTPDKPADFSGGLVQISTVEFPPQFFLELSATSSYDDGTSFHTFSTYQGGKRDFLGIDDGTRKMPSIINSDKVLPGNFSNDQLQEIGLSFNNNWNTSSMSAPLNTGYKLSFGDKYEFNENTLGVVASLSYSQSFDIKEQERSSYTFEGPRYEYSGANYNHSILWGALANLSFKFNKTNKISLKNIYNQVADDDVTLLAGNYRYADQYRQNTSIKYLSRSLFSSQLLGEHFFNLFNGTTWQWNFSYGKSKRDEPDSRRYMYYRDIYEEDAPLRFMLDQSLATRFYGKLDDVNFGFNTDFTLKLFKDPNLPTVKTGFLFDKKEREFDARIFGFRNKPGGSFFQKDSILQLPVENIFRPENIRPNFIEVVEITKPNDSYSSNQTVYGGYGMIDFAIFRNFKVTTGVRYEHSEQILNSKTITGEELEVAHKYDDILPALNIRYMLTDNINLRAAYSKTLARPEFRELAPYSYYDFVAGEVVIGNENLTRTLIDNFDLRFEFFPALGELYAISFFYKHFIDPIEQVMIASSGFEPLRTFANAKEANNYGIEIEVRKNLGFISSALNDFSVINNLSLIKSRIDVSNAVLEGFTSTERPLQGQSDYIFNFGLYYDNYDADWYASVVYNKIGQRIDKVGFSGLGDVIEMPRDQIDLSVTKKIFKNIGLKLTVKDILAQNHRFVQRTPDGDKDAELYRKGSSVSFSIAYQF